MNQVVVRALVQPHTPVVALFQHFNSRLACREPGALGDALDVGLADDRRELAPDNFSAAYEVDPHFAVLTGVRWRCVGGKSYLIGAWRKTLAVRHEASSDLNGTQQRRRR